MMKLKTMILALLFACNDKIEVENTTEVIVPDYDQDGFPADVDCDDWDASVHPEAPEICDGRDNNCSGEVDENVTSVFYPDRDGDGFGSDDELLQACAPPEGYIVVGNDCDDQNAEIYPGAEEICDVKDNDCDDEIDEGLLQGFFLDADGDGFGDPNSPAEDCSNDLSLYVKDELDCDDSNPEIYPLALETCDEIDNDCDGEIDEEGSGNQVWYIDEDGDGFGNLLIAMNACDQPDGWVSNSTDCNDTNSDQYPEAGEWCNGEDDDCDGIIDEDPNDPLIFYQDADNDGFGSMAVVLPACTQPVGYVVDNTDCDDTNPSVSPTAPEICNLSDDNCNGTIDENAIGIITLYQDGDGDGFGDVDASIASCDPSLAGYVLNSLDCNDADAGQSPLGIESCNGLDDNCNGEIDEGADDAKIWFRDGDGDGFGGSSEWEQGCEGSVGFVLNNTDCDDEDPDYNPDTLELCNGVDDNCNGQVDEDFTIYKWYTDGDGDGFGDPSQVVETCDDLSLEGKVQDNTDCDDSDPNYNPDTPEICNQVDDNCDGQVDEGFTVYNWYVDSDGDGFGDPRAVESSCNDLSLEGKVLNNTDCDDDDSSYNPNTPELCNGIDDNCDGQVDEGFTIYQWYDDSDGDGFGDPRTVEETCNDLSSQGKVLNNTDCDDADPNYNPDTPEVCNQADDNCDGQVDEGFTVYQWYDDSDGDGFGDPSIVVQSCTDLSLDGKVTNNTDCDDGNPDKNVDTPEICNGLDDNCDGRVDEGFLLQWYYDLDGDGFGDPSTVIESCEVQQGMVQNNTDCDDDNPDKNPEKVETCNGFDDNCDGQIDEEFPILQWYVDGDGDGFGDPGSVESSCNDLSLAGKVLNNTDCDDDNPDKNLDTPEICNGLDDNCDGQIDEGFTVYQWYNDSDGDGFGDPSTVVASCNDLSLEGKVQNNTDCDDSDPNYNPDTPEICNQADDNCDGQVDEGFTVYQWYVDGDGDGFGDPGTVESSCTDLSLEGKVTNNTDCDDDNPDYNPDTPELCNGLDDNCDGQVDEGFTIYQWYYDEDGDGFGSPWTVIESCDDLSAEGKVQDNTDCDDTDSDNNPAREEVCNGLDDNCDGQIDEGFTVYQWYVDADGDGFGDPSTVESSCNDLSLEGKVLNNTDCDDENTAKNPNTPEVCNGLDDNCDGQVDEDFTVYQWYNDSDGDGFGDPSVVVASCNDLSLEGKVQNNTDCDDDNSDYNPDTPELCNGVDDNCDGQVDEGFTVQQWYVDSDGDGFGDPSVVESSCDDLSVEGKVNDNTDCDDSDPNYNPDTPELCNGADDNCDGQVDEGFTVYQWYKDNDGDGFGSPWSVIESCETQVGMVQNNTDCDDTDSTNNPDTPEVCNGVDDNCDGQIDEGFTVYQWYNDADGDGFGDPSTVEASCNDLAVEGKVLNNSDCDDANATHNPNTPELCNGADDNCDGQIDEGFTIYQWYYDVDGDGFGDPSTVIEDCELIVDMVQNNGDCDDGDPSHNPDTPELCNGADDNCNGQVDENFTVYQWYYDDDGDGFGSPWRVIESCDDLSADGKVQDNTDCDDDDPSHNPQTPEICNGSDDNCDGQVDEGFTVYQWYMDVDEDGFGDPGSVLETCLVVEGMVEDNTDCDDDDPDYNPDTPELCNEVDDNCDGQVDEGFTVYQWYNDDDGDGFGSPWAVVETCAVLPDKVQDNTDCDDSDPNYNPDTPELCNGVDDNCDGQVDEGFAVYQWYNDTDGDGFGDPGSVIETCNDLSSEGKVLNNSDCDDSDPNYNPDTPELCNGVDDNCNGQIDEGFAVYQWYYDNDGDGYGSPWIEIESCAQIPGMVTDNTDCNDDNPSVNPGADEICDGLDNNCDGYLDDDSAIDAYSGFLDLDGDGYGGGDLVSSCDDILFALDDDCDDDDATINPSETEVCDGVDNDCNGNIDSDALCDQALPDANCTLRRYQGSSYLFCRNNRTWSVARGDCASVGYFLTTIEDSTENTWIDDQIDNLARRREWWIGYNDYTVEGLWDWDGPYSTYTNWGSGEPNDSQGNEDCALLNTSNNGGRDGKWNDADCLTSTYFICETNP